MLTYFGSNSNFLTNIASEQTFIIPSDEFFSASLSNTISSSNFKSVQCFGLWSNPCKSKAHSCDLMPMLFMFSVPYVTSARGGALSKQNKIHLAGVTWEGQRCRGEPCWAAQGRLDSPVQSQTSWWINTRGHCRVCTCILCWLLTEAKGEMYLTSWT